MSGTFDLKSLVLLSALTIALVLRYTRLFVGIYANLTYKAFPVAKNPTFSAKDVTVIVPTTFKTPDELVQCLNCINTNAPHEIIIVTGNANVDTARTLCKLNAFKNVSVIGIDKLCKRDQQILGIKQVQTDIIVFADDDVFWPAGYLEQLLAIFENPRVGAGGSCQRLRRQANTNAWDFLGTSYLERRVFNNITTNAVDGSISTLSGRSAAYRTEILKTDKFYYDFTHDTFFAYAHGFLNLYALCTMTTTVWGNHNLAKLEKPKAVGAEVVPLLKETQAKATYPVPTPGKLMVGEDYFSAKLAAVDMV